MRQALLIFVFLVQMVIASFSALAQSNYPIFVSPSLLPPYSLQLSDYSAHGSQRLMVTIVVNDLEVANLPVKLRLTMETAGATIETPVTLNTTPIYLDGGSATVLFGEDLYDYFNLNNLQFKGFSKEAYQRSGQMPEGFYRFSIEVLHFHTNRVISNTGTTSAWMALGHPPVLRLPANDAELGQYVGVPITFSWLSSNVGSPVSAGSIRYKFELWEVRVKGVNPYNIVGSMPVFYEHVTSTNSYSFNPASVMMEEGMTYAWRVTAFDESGLVPFAQNGQSEVRTFTYKSRCEAVSDISATAGGQKGSFVWTPEKNHTSFNVEVRNAATDWFSASETYDSKVEFFQLERGQTYELRVQAVCNGDAASVSDYSSWTSLLIPEKKPDESNDDCPDCACSDDLPDVELTNFELRQDLTVGDTLTNKTGTTRFIVREVNAQGNGIYSGVFYFWGELWGMKVPCEFSDLQVNTDNVIVNMDYKSINDPKFIVDIDALAGAGSDLLDQLATVTAKTSIVDTIAVQQEFDYVVVKDGELYAVVVEQDTVVERPMGVSLEEAKQKLITSADGGEVVISSKGEPMGVQEFKATGGNNRLVKSYNEQKEKEQLTEGSMVGFLPYDKQNYGFDAYDPLKQRIQHFYPSLDNGYRPAFKSVESFRYDKVLTDASSDISFRDEMGIPALSATGALNVQGHIAGSNRALYAYRALSDSTEEVVGKLNVVSFDNTLKRVHVVPVNGAKMPTQSQLEHTLKQVYKQAIATWTVVSEPGVSVHFPGGRMTHEGSGTFSTYNDDQTAIVDAYVATGRKIERGDLYLFFVEGATFKDRSLAGYMPLNRQVGFIYDNPSPIIVAHELGHGAFTLRPTFSPEEFIQDESKTQNLMDYAGGTDLWKYQWDLIHDPEKILFSWAQSEEEGQHLMGTYEYSHLLLEEFRKAYVNKKTSTVDMPHYVQFFGSLKMSLFDGVEEPLMIWNENGTKRTNFTLDGTKKHTPIVWTENTDVLIYDIGNNVQFKVYKKDKERLEKYLYPASEEERIAQIQTAIDKIDKDISNSNMIAILAAIPTGEYRLITLEQRKIALEKITSEMMNESGPNKINEEVIAINLLKYNNSDQDLFNILFENPQLVFNLMKRMHDEGGNDNYTALIRELTLLYYKQSLDLVNRLALETNTYLIWSRKYLPPYFNTAYEVDFEGDKISIVGKVSILPGNLEDIMEIDGYFDKQYYNPFDVLIVDFNTKANCIGIEGPLQMPVFMFKWMMDNIYKADAKLGIDIAVTTASFVIGVGAVKTAVQAGSKAWKVALAISAAAHAGSKVYFKLDDEVAEKLINSGESGERFLKVWKGMDKVFDGVTITESIVNQSFPLLFAFSKSFDTLSKDLGKDNLKEILGDETYEMFIKLHTVINTELLAL